MCLVKLFMAPESKMGFGYIVGKLIICGFRNQWNYFSKEVRKVFYLTLKQGTLNMKNEHKTIERKAYAHVHDIR